MKVTFAHAFIIAKAYEFKYSTIAVIEEDAIFLRRNFSSSVLESFALLLSTRDWGLIRLGFRPYFLQTNAVAPCPRKCRCIIGRFGENLCELRFPGCDMRSSDAYIINMNHYVKLKGMLLNLRVPNANRIIDTVPMRSMQPQWILLPQASFQTTLDVPLDYQVGLSALYVTKCVGPRPLSQSVRSQAMYLIDT